MVLNMKEGTMTRMQSGIIAVALAAAAGLADISALFTEPVLVDAACGSKHWANVYTNAVPLAWGWESTNVVRAELVINGMNGSWVTNFTTAASNWLWHVSEEAVPATEDVYTLRLSFYDANDAMVGAVTSRLAVVTGAFGETLVDPVMTSRSWTKVRNNVVIPYHALWAAAGTNAVSSQIVIDKIGGAVETNGFTDVSGYMGWKVRNTGWGYGTFDLSLTFVGVTNAWTAELMRPMDGTAVSIR